MDETARRPVYERLLQRKHHMPLEPPTSVEYEDALLVLVEAVERLDAGGELEEEALRILEESSPRSS